MNIDTINLKKINKAVLIEALIDGSFEVPNKHDIAELFERLEIAIGAGDYLTSRNALIIGQYFESAKFFERIQRKGLFRYSKYSPSKSIVQSLASELLESGVALNRLTPSTEAYLNSIINFAIADDLFKQLEADTLTEIKRFEKKYPVYAG